MNSAPPIAAWRADDASERPALARHHTAACAAIVARHSTYASTGTRSAEDIAQAIDSIGGQLDAFTAKEYASYYIKVLDEHLPLALDILSDIVLNPAFGSGDVEREKKVVVEEIKMVEDTPDDLVHELFTQHFWEGHALGRPILGSKETVESFTPGILREYFGKTYVAPHLIVSAAGNIQHAQVRELRCALRDRIVQRESSLVEQHQCRDGRHRLAHRRDAEDRVALDWKAARQVAAPDRRLVDNLAVAPGQCHSAGKLSGIDELLDRRC